VDAESGQALEDVRLFRKGAARMSTRKSVPIDVVVKVLTESGFRCGVPTCRGILAIDLHHMAEVSIGGSNTPDNLLPLCPTCHALYHRGTIPAVSIYAWKAVLVSLSQAFDVQTVDTLLFLNNESVKNLRVSGDGVLHFSRLVASGLADFRLFMQNGPLLIYSVYLTPKGEGLVTAWKSGDWRSIEMALGKV
jgi:hypothetical protein